jgi:hypothetical protein
VITIRRTTDLGVLCVETLAQLLRLVQQGREGGVVQLALVLQPRVGVPHLELVDVRHKLCSEGQGKKSAKREEHLWCFSMSHPLFMCDNGHG